MLRWEVITEVGRGAKVVGDQKVWSCGKRNNFYLLDYKLSGSTTVSDLCVYGYQIVMISALGTRTGVNVHFGTLCAPSK